MYRDSYDYDITDLTDLLWLIDAKGEVALERGRECHPDAVDPAADAGLITLVPGRRGLLIQLTEEGYAALHGGDPS